MAAVEIRQLGPEEWETLRAVRLRALADAPEAFGSSLERELAFDEATWRSRTVTSAQFLAVAGSEPAGLAAARNPAGPARELVSMWVAPRHRRHGVGAALVARVAEHVRGEGARELRLWVVVGNEEATAFYGRLGFEATGETQPVPDGSGRSEMEMRLAVA
ncbi:MAG TPA: GNAT family N-acetyltransferase [Acidimicrobiales bacterium]|nr:GNAT family N-acetyltransferase [Acidimicrobiales bacterium]